VKAALVIVYNHRYCGNIARIESIYGKRFRHIFHLMPFYEGNAPNVIAVYDNSYCFQGYLAQGIKSIPGAEDYDHLLFVADDLLLNPGIDENNYQNRFGLDGETAYIHELEDMPAYGYWPHNRRAVHFAPFNVKAHNTRGVEAAGLLPSPSEALALLQRHGIKNSKITFHSAYGNFFKSFRYSLKNIAEDLFVQMRIYPCRLRYPLCAAYSDIVIVPGRHAAAFAHLCGVFASLRLFVEIAIPTALAMTCEKIRLLKDLPARVVRYLSEEEMREMEVLNYDFEALERDFPADVLWIHPVKLSQWMKGKT
jgi:hypothetical protein